MQKLRFLNPDLHARLLAGLKARGLDTTISSDGTVVCSDEQWPAVNNVAHAIRDGCFKWYFSWCETPADTEERVNYLRSEGLRFELEDHGDRVIFLLPKEDMARHSPPSDTGPDACSFCGKSYVEIKSMWASASAAICDECIEMLHRELQVDADDDN